MSASNKGNGVKMADVIGMVAAISPSGLSKLNSKRIMAMPVSCMPVSMAMVTALRLPWPVSLLAMYPPIMPRYGSSVPAGITYHWRAISGYT